MNDSPESSSSKDKSYEDILHQCDEALLHDSNGGRSSVRQIVFKRNSLLSLLGSRWFLSAVFLSISGLASLAFFGGSLPRDLNEANQLRYAKHPEAAEDLQAVDKFLNAPTEYRSTRSPEFRTAVNDLNKVLFSDEEIADEPFAPDDFILFDGQVMFDQD